MGKITHHAENVFGSVLQTHISAARISEGATLMHLHVCVYIRIKTNALNNAESYMIQNHIDAIVFISITKKNTALLYTALL